MFKVHFQHITEKGFIRTGVIVIKAKDAESASRMAQDKLTLLNYHEVRVKKVTPYA